MLGGYLLVAAVLLPLAAAQATQWQSTTCASGAYAANSTYQTNLGLLAAALPANVSASPAGFTTATVGVVPDLISALALCRGDTNASSCRACVAAGFPGAQRGCPNSKDVAIYQDDCVLRFSDQRFLDFVGVESPAGTYSWDVENLAAPAAWFNAAALALLNATVDQAVAATARGDPAKKYFATGEESFDATYYPKIYGLAQCVPEMTAAQCRGCLAGFIGAAVVLVPEREVWRPSSRGLVQPEVQREPVLHGRRHGEAFGAAGASTRIRAFCCYRRDASREERKSGRDLYSRRLFRCPDVDSCSLCSHSLQEKKG